MNTGDSKTENRGGKREGSGRKRVSISDGEVKKLLREFRRKEKETGKSVWGELASIALRSEKRVTVKEQTVAIKLYAECTISRASEQNVSVTKKTEPSIYLPQSLPDPAKLVAVNGGKS